MQTKSTSQVNVSFFPPAAASTLEHIKMQQNLTKSQQRGRAKARPEARAKARTSLLHSRYINFAIRPFGGSQDFRTELELETLLLQNALEVFGHLHINAHSAHMA